MKKFNFFGLIVFACTSCFIISCSPDVQEERKITVIGTSTVYATPDVAIVSFAIVSQDKNLSNAKQKNDNTLKKINSIFDGYKIEQKNITLGRLNINPRYSYRHEPAEFLYYEITQDISISIEDLNNYEPFLTDILNSGIDRIYNVEFSVKDIKKYKTDARIAAVKAAEEKAAILCSAANNGGKKLSTGKILQINEIPQQHRNYSGMMQNIKAYDEEKEGMPDNGVTPIGQIQVNSQIEIVFRLK